MEDIINFINGRIEILEDIKDSEPDLKDFIIMERILGKTPINFFPMAYLQNHN